VFLAALLRRELGQKPLAPDPALDTAADLLRMMQGAPAPEAHVHALDTYLATIADHGFNASTFTARVIASTRAGLISAVVGGLCALKGPLHGGAPGPVLDMLDEIGTVENIVPWLETAIRRGDRLMGFGHRIYKVRDPRADVLKAVAKTLGPTSGRLAFAGEVERQVLATLRRLKPGRRLDTNVEFYTALVLEAIGIRRQAFTPLFAVGRAVGWCAHVFEQERGGRIIRPLSTYVGPLPKQAA
jgi:citrate synthase